MFGKGLTEPVQDHAVKRPSTIYGQTKVACENALEWYRRNRGLSDGAVRFVWVYGPGRVNGLTANFSSFLLDAVARAEEVTIDNPDQIGDWLYIRDAVKALCLLLERRGHKQLAYNISGSVHSVGEATDIARELFPKARINIRRKDHAPYPYASTFDDTAARNELGWRPDYSIRKGMLEHVEAVLDPEGMT